MARHMILCLGAAAALLGGCRQKDAPEEPQAWETDDPIEIAVPVPQKQIARIGLSERQETYVEAGNALSLKLLQKLYASEGKDFVFSPLSLQFALAMTANGTRGNTAAEIVRALGYGEDGLEALNAYSRILLEQLPAVDLDVKLQLADALVVNRDYPLLPAFCRTVEESYYAAVENMDFSDSRAVLARINEWASRNTEGLINPLLEEVDPAAVAFLMNALYFKAKWQESGSPMFLPEATAPGPFYGPDGSTSKVSYMTTFRRLPYADMGDFRVAALPYASGKYAMYILLPKEKNGLPKLMETIPSLTWKDLDSRLKTETDVYLRLPKFHLSGDFDLKETLISLGVRQAFTGGADFSGMFDTTYARFCISRVLQKARISVEEWGTEAAAVTVVEIKATSVGPGTEEPVEFFADHPFVFVIGERTSGTILFEGVYSGE